MKYLVWIISLLIVGCSGNEDQKESTIVKEQEEVAIEDSTTGLHDKEEILGQAQNDENGFLNFYKKFTKAISAKNHQAFNNCISTNFGLYTIESAGALPLIFHVYDIENFKPINLDKKFLSLEFKAISNKPIFEELPKIICDEDFYDKVGCFANESDRLKNSRIWNYANLNEKEIQAIEFLVETVKMTVINTENYTYHFSIIDEIWYITFIDIRKPCSA